MAPVSAGAAFGAECTLDRHLPGGARYPRGRAPGAGGAALCRCAITAPPAAPALAAQREGGARAWGAGAAALGAHRPSPPVHLSVRPPARRELSPCQPAPPFQCWRLRRRHTFSSFMKTPAKHPKHDSPLIVAMATLGRSQPLTVVMETEKPTATRALGQRGRADTTGCGQRAPRVPGAGGGGGTRLAGGLCCQLAGPGPRAS